MRVRRIVSTQVRDGHYTEHYANKHARSGSPNSSQKDVALSLRFDVKDWWIIKLEGHTIWGTPFARGSGEQSERPPDE